MYIYVHVYLSYFVPVSYAGMKYRYARQWGIRCVSDQWFHDSVAAGYSMAEEEYDVDKEAGEGGEGGEGANETSRKR